MGKLLALRNVCKVFRPETLAPIPALTDASLDVDSGSFVCVIGANGSGKSTLLRVIAGVYRDAGGSIWLRGEEIQGWSEQRRARAITLVDQTPGARLAPGLTIEQNMALASMRAGRSLWRPAVTRGDRETFRSILASLGLGLEDRLGAHMRELSGGQAQALSVASATCLVPPDLLLLDEHCASLDARMGHMVMEMTSALCRDRGITAMMVTHDFEFASRYGDRLVLMSEGRIVLDLDHEQKRSLGPRDVFDIFMQHQTGAAERPGAQHRHIQPAPPSASGGYRRYRGAVEE